MFTDESAAGLDDDRLGVVPLPDGELGVAPGDVQGPPVAVVVVVHDGAHVGRHRLVGAGVEEAGMRGGDGKGQDEEALHLGKNGMD